MAYSFGGSPVHGPGPANRKLAIVVALRLAIGKGAILVVQDYLEALLLTAEVRPDLVVRKHREEGKFLGTEEVTSQYAEFLRRLGVSEVLLIAHPFLHWRKCKKLLEAEGFSVKVVTTGKVPFDPFSEGWWARSRRNLFLYTLLQLATGRQGR